MGDARPERDMKTRGVALVVDDDSSMRTFIKDVLAWEGIQVQELPSGEGLVDAVGQEEVVLVVLDKEMPGSSGLDLVAYLRGRCPEVPVIVITAFGGSRVRGEAMARGAATYLDKPFRVGDFLQAVRQVLGSTRPGAGAPDGRG